MHDRYSQEIRALENNARDRQLLREKVRSIIIRTYPHTAYPYINYAEAIHNDYRHFEPYVHALNAHTYPQLTLDAQKTLDLLAQLHDLVVTDSEYLASLRDRERKQLEQERIEAQRAYAAAQQRQARALEHQNNIQERQMYAARRCCCHPHCGPVCVEYVEIVPVPAPVHVGFSVGW
jgi:hypothetical protein